MDDSHIFSGGFSACATSTFLLSVSVFVAAHAVINLAPTTCFNCALKVMSHLPVYQQPPPREYDVCLHYVNTTQHFGGGEWQSQERNRYSTALK